MSEWQRSLAHYGGTVYRREVRDGHVEVKRLPYARSWSIFHNGKQVSLQWKSAKVAMEYVDDAECGG